MRKIPARIMRVATGIATPTAILAPCESPLLDWVFVVFVFIAVVAEFAEVELVDPVVVPGNRICTALASAPVCHSPNRL
jgi:hypothetical protein